MKFGADFSNLRDTTEWDLFFPARVIFANLGGPGPTFFNHTPVVFWWPIPTGTTQGVPTPVPFTQAVPTPYQGLPLINFDHNSFGVFAQDEWKATPKLMLTYGLRYDFETYPDEIVPRDDLNNFQRVWAWLTRLTRAPWCARDSGFSATASLRAALVR